MKPVVTGHACNLTKINRTSVSKTHWREGTGKKKLTWRNQQICQMIRDLCLNFDDRTRNSSRGWWQWSCSVAYNTRKSPGKTYFFFGTTEKNIDVVRNLNYLYFSNGLCVYLIKLIYCLRNYFVFDLILVLI